MNSAHKTIYIALVVAAVILLAAVWWWQTNPPVSPAPTATPLNVSDTPAAIQNELNGIDVGNVDADFQSIDKDLQNL